MWKSGGITTARNPRSGLRAATVRERDNAGENAILIAATLLCGADPLVCAGPPGPASWHREVACTPFVF